MSKHWALDIGFTLLPLCLSNAWLAITKDSFFPPWRFRSWTYFEDEWNIVFSLSLTGVLRQLTICKISLLWPSGIPARSFSVRYFALAVNVKPLLHN